MIPDEWLPHCSVSRIICHWTGGSYVISDEDRLHYHFIVSRDGSVARGIFSVADNASTSHGKYAAHVSRLNTGAIGVAIAGMAGVNPPNPGGYPMLEEQWESMVQLVAMLCKRYELEVSERTVLGHGEVERVYGVPQFGAIDPLFLPWRPSLHPVEVGDLLRSQVRALLSSPHEEHKVYVQVLVGEQKMVALAENGTTWVGLEDICKTLGCKHRYAVKLPHPSVDIVSQFGTVRVQSRVETVYGVTMTLVPLRPLLELTKRSVQWDEKKKVLVLTA